MWYFLQVFPSSANNRRRNEAGERYKFLSAKSDRSRFCAVLEELGLQSSVRYVEIPWRRDRENVTSER